MTTTRRETAHAKHTAAANAADAAYDKARTAFEAAGYDAADPAYLAACAEHALLSAAAVRLAVA